MDDDTIIAPATPAGKSAISVIRISGPATRKVLRRLVAGLPANPRPRCLFRGRLIVDGRPVDDCLAAFFPAPASYTAEDLAEISLHGNPALVQAALTAAEQAGARPARPGEFTFRAFKNGKIDLIQAEAIEQLVACDSAGHSSILLSSLEGGLSRLLQKLRDELRQLAAGLEMAIEFSADDPEIPVFSAGGKQLIETLQRILTARRFQENRAGTPQLVICGRPNTGKSTLFNALLLQERSIVSSRAGTTRDFIEEKIFCNSAPILLADVAGLQQQAFDENEAEGIRRSLLKIRESSAAIVLFAADSDFDETDAELLRLTAEKKRLLLITKADLADSERIVRLAEKTAPQASVALCLHREDQLQPVFSFLQTLAVEPAENEESFYLNQRQCSLLRELMAQIVSLSERHDEPEEIQAEKIRRALDAIGRLTGEISTEDVLQAVFANFCVGK